MFYGQLYKYFTTYNLFHNSQYGSWREQSTELAALELIDRVTLKMHKGKIPFAIFLDFSKAFDSLNQKTLLNKLSYYGVNPGPQFPKKLSNRQKIICLHAPNAAVMSGHRLRLWPHLTAALGQRLVFAGITSAGSI